MTAPGRPAVFFDRDGTLVVDPGYLRDPATLVLVPGAAAAIARLNAAGRLVVVVTNQAGIGRGKLSVGDYRSVMARLDRLLADEGAHLDATYFCPHAPEIDGVCSCRKPGLRLYRQAADELRIEFGDSWWVGDRLADVAAATALGGRGILVLSGHGAEHSAEAAAAGYPVVTDAGAATELILTRGST